MKQPLIPFVKKGVTTPGIKTHLHLLAYFPAVVEDGQGEQPWPTEEDPPGQSVELKQILGPKQEVETELCCNQESRETPLVSQDIILTNCPALT